MFNTVSSFLIVLLFIYTGSSKLIMHKLFVDQLSQFDYLKKIKAVISVLLPVLEIVTGLLIAIISTQIFGWWLACMLLTVFTMYVSIMLLSKSHLPCTCGGVIASMTWKQHLAFNIFFMLLSWYQLYNFYKVSNKNISTNTRK